MASMDIKRIEEEIENLKRQVGGLQDRVDLTRLELHKHPDEKEFKAALADLTNTLSELNRLTALLDELLEESLP